MIPCNAAILALLALLTPISEVSAQVAPVPIARALPATPSAWTGHATRLGDYFVAPGYPAYAAHPRYLGELKGTWREIGRQYGEKAGDLIRFTYEGWYREVLLTQGSNEAIADYVHQEASYYQTLLPEALELMAGIAEGAHADLATSPLADRLSDFDKVLMINSYYGLQAPPPGVKVASDDQRPERVPACSGAVIWGAATKDGALIHVSSEDQHFFPQEYLVTFVVVPSDPKAHRFTVTDTAGEIGSEHALNDVGVASSGYSGGALNIAEPTLAAPFSGYRRPGLDWQVGNFYVAAFAGTAQEAVTLLTVGRESYRQRSGLKVVIGKCRKGANWVVSDRREGFVVESIPADEQGIARHAVRKAGDLGERGNCFVVSCNNAEAPYSVDEQGRRDDAHPMSRHGHFSQGPTPYLGLSHPGQRYWTLTWLIRNAFGQITPELVKAWRASHAVYDEQGQRHKTFLVNGKARPTHLAPKSGTLCAHSVDDSGTDTFKGVNTYVSLTTPDSLTVQRTVGRPCEWVGPWDLVCLDAPKAISKP